ncbi:MAG: LruC domain-containing protein [Bacteroidales bacterium]|nr:LruC domain-containing protein [Bacteroidales bacterium]
MKKILPLFILSSVLMIFLTGCQKEFKPDTKTYEHMKDLEVPSSFGWKTTRDVLLKVSLPSDGVFPIDSRLTVFIGDPLFGGEKLSSGSLRIGEPFEQMIRIPAYLKTLHLLLESSVGARYYAEVAASANTITYVFNPNQKDLAFKSLSIVVDDGPECDDCDQVISGSGNITIGNGQTYCVTDSFNGRITFQTWNGGGTLKVCGTATLTGNTTLGTNSHIIVTQSGVLNINNLSMWGNSASVTVYADAELNVGNGFSTVGTFTNHGQITIDGSLTVQQLVAAFTNTGTITVSSNGFQLNNAQMNNTGSILVTGSFKLNTNSALVSDGIITSTSAFEINGSQFTNNGEVTVSQSNFSINGGATFTNNGSLEVTEGSFSVNSNSMVNNGSIEAGNKISFNSGSVVTNNCMMSCDGLAEFNSGNITFNNGYLRSESKIQVNSGSNLQLNNASMLSTTQFELYANITGQQSSSSIKATTQFKMSSQTVSGPIELSTDNLNILPGTPIAQHFINGATVVALGEEQNFLPVTSCNPEGMGSIIINDTDNDGVMDDIDDFPNDGTRAYRSWYPGENNFSTIAFEDLWPGIGDFDFNDVVIEFQYEIITNSSNQLVDLVGRFKLLAAGASLNNGFGVAIPVDPANVGTVTGGQIDGNAIVFAGNGAEAGHANQTVIIVFDAINTTYGGNGYINTIQDLPYIETDTVQVTVNFSSPQASYGAAPFNPFIFIDQERGKEVHLLDFQPTALADPQYFGIWEDRSIPASGEYYKTDANLPWAIEIPVSFSYPKETIDILATHLKFAEWAVSGGTLYQDWYLDLPGYRNASNIYQVPAQ